MLTAGVERGGRLVEHDDVRLMQKNKAGPPLLAPGTGLIPWRLLLKAIDEVLMPTRLSASATSSMRRARLRNIPSALSASSSSQACRSARRTDACSGVGSRSTLRAL